MKQVKERYTLVPPDGGWGWMVFLGGAISTVSLSLGHGTSVLIIQTIERYHTTTGAVGLIATILFTVASFSGPVVSSLCAEYSTRVIGMIGSILLSLACVIAFLGDSILTLQLSKGILGGIAFSCILNTSIINVNRYFSKKRARVNCLMTASLGLGRIILAPAMFYCVDTYGYRGAMLVMGAVTLHGAVGAMLYQPVEWHMKRVPVEMMNKNPVKGTDKSLAKQPTEIKDLMDNKEKQAEIEMDTYYTNGTNNYKNSVENLPELDVVKTQEQRRQFIRHNSMFGSNPGLQIVEEEPSKRGKDDEKKILRVLKKCVPDFGIMRSPIFLLMSYVMPMGILTMTCMNTYMPTLCAENGYIQNQTATVLSCIAISDTSIKVIGSFVLDKVQRLHKYIFVSAHLVAFFATLGIILSRNYWIFIVYVLLYGSAIGLANSLNLTLMFTYLGPEAFANAFGLQQFIQGFLSMFMMSGIGFSRDATGDARVPFFIILSLQFIVIVVCCFEPLIMRTKSEIKDKYAAPL